MNYLDNIFEIRKIKGPQLNALNVRRFTVEHLLVE